MRQMGIGFALLSALAVAAAASAVADAQPTDVDCAGCREAVDTRGVGLLNGTWSSALTSPQAPGWSAEDFFCFVACTSEAWSAAIALLRDPANAQVPTLELLPRVVGANAAHAASLLLAPPSVRPIAGAGRPITCDPHDFVTQVLSALPLQIEVLADGVTLRYEEFAVERYAAFTSPAAAQRAGRLGVSTARVEDGSLVIVTTQLPAGRFYDWFGAIAYGDRLRVTERYSVSSGGEWLQLDVAFEDPATLREPLRLRKRWRRTPDVELLPYECEAISGVR